MAGESEVGVLRALELFCGIGGWRYALGERGQVEAAYDISPAAQAAYLLNHGEACLAREVASLPRSQILAHGAHLWMMSPPCQPFCRMGNQQGLEDSRSRAFLRLLEILDEAPPVHLVLENVSGFRGSEAHERLDGILQRHGFHCAEFELCPTRFGIPNQRPRFFLVASQKKLLLEEPPDRVPDVVGKYLDAEEDLSLYLSEAILAKHKPGLDLVRAEDRRTACFIGGYGRRYVGSGSFLLTDKGVRRFSLGEIARLLGLPSTFRLPSAWPLETRYKLLGNSLSIPVARWVLNRIDLDRH